VRGRFAGSLIDAYEAAGYSRDSGNAKRLAQRADVAARIDELREGEAARERESLRSMLAAMGIDKARIMREFATIAFASRYSFLDEDGNLDLTVSARAHAGALRELAVDTVTRRDGSTVSKVRIKLNDKRHALAELERFLRMAGIPAAADDADRPTPQQTEDTVVGYLRQLTNYGTDVEALAKRAVATAAPRPAHERSPWRTAQLSDALCGAVADHEQALGDAIVGEALAQQDENGSAPAEQPPPEAPPAGTSDASPGSDDPIAQLTTSPPLDPDAAPAGDARSDADVVGSPTAAHTDPTAGDS
jgi:hypothetical protein